MNVDFSLMDEAQSFVLPPLLQTINLILTFAIFVFILFLIQTKNCAQLNKKTLSTLNVILIVSLSFLTLKNIFLIQKNFLKANPPKEITKLESVFHFSKNKKNVLVVMPDRSVSSMFSFALEEKPEFKKSYDGFVYFPNTISFSHYTTLGAPPLFGGYDFTPWEINLRTELSIRDKHNQSLLTMPKIFSENNFNVTVTNMPYENYNEQPVEKIYDGIKNFSRVKTQGAYSEFWCREHNIELPAQISFLLKKNILYFSIFKMCNPLFRVVPYEVGYRLTGNPYKDFSYLIDTYAPLDLLLELCDFSASENTFTVFDTELTHASGFLQVPNYEPAVSPTDIGSRKLSNNPNYHMLMAFLSRFEEFILYLKQNNCYDNMRIIIASDHGNGFESGKFDNTPCIPSMQKESVQAFLLVKDFGEHGELKTDMTFMTNADVPYLSTKDLILDAKNPFTGNPLKVLNKNDYAKISCAKMQSLRTRDDKAFTIPNDEWFAVYDNIFITENWSRIFEK